MSHVVRWLPSARRDRTAQLEFIRGENPRAAVTQGDRITAATRHLAQHPDLGREGRVAGTRELVIDRTPFVVVYRATGAHVEILKLLHGSQAWPAI